MSVLESNDPIARSLTMQAIGSIAILGISSKELHHRLLRTLARQNIDHVEHEAAVFCSSELARKDPLFAQLICNFVYRNVLNLTYNDVEKYQGLYCAFQYVSHTEGGRDMCDTLLTKQRSILSTQILLDAMTKLSMRSVIFVEAQIKFLIQKLPCQLKPTQSAILHCLFNLTGQKSSDFDSSDVQKLVKFANSDNNPANISGAAMVINAILRDKVMINYHIDSRLLLETFLQHQVTKFFTISTIKYSRHIVSIAITLLSGEVYQSYLHLVSEWLESLLNLLPILDLHVNACIQAIWSLSSLLSAHDSNLYTKCLMLLEHPTHGALSTKLILATTKRPHCHFNSILAYLRTSTMCSASKVNLLVHFIPSDDMQLILPPDFFPVDDNWSRYKVAALCLSYSMPNISHNLLQQVRSKVSSLIILGANRLEFSLDQLPFIDF